jgi:hypothetical protein
MAISARIRKGTLGFVQGVMDDALRLTSRASRSREGDAVFSEVLSTRFVAGLLQTEFFLAFDLHDLGVVHGDFHRTEAQVAQCALNFPQDGCFVLAVNAT